MKSPFTINNGISIDTICSQSIHTFDLIFVFFRSSFILFYFFNQREEVKTDNCYNTVL